MKDPFKKLIKSKVDKYAKLLGIQDYTYHIDIIGTKKQKSTEQYDVYATVDIDEETRNACIEVNKKLLMRDKNEIESTVAHELLHVRLNELLTLLALIIELYVKDKKAKKAYAGQIEALEHKIIVPLANALAKKHKDGKSI